jgi:hypothetical protein
VASYWLCVCTPAGIVCLTLELVLLLAAQLSLFLIQQLSLDASGWARNTITALPAHLVSSFTASQELPAAASTLTTLTSLSSTGRHGDCYRVPASVLRPLSQLRQLRLKDVDLGSTVEETLALPALKGLQALVLQGCS